MAATELKVTLTAATWTLVTAADTTSIRIQNISGQRLWIKGAIGAVPPVGIPQALGAIMITPGNIQSNTLANLFPGGGLVTRVYAYSDFAADVPYSHP